MFISKILAVFIDPVGIMLAFFAVGALAAFFPRWVKMSAALFICGFAALVAFSSPLTAHVLLRGLEGQYLPAPEYAPADAVVFLGGATVGQIPPRIYPEINIAGNRVFNAVRVYRQTKSPKMVLTGGLTELISDEIVPEANTMFELLNEHFGIDTSDVLIENKSRNTRDNAVNTKQVMEEAGMGLNIILVTSAFHMPRAVGVFTKAGFTVTPSPTGYFKNSKFTDKPLNWLPCSKSLFESSIAIREYCGILSYKIMGWL